MKPKEFFDALGTAAQASAATTGVPASFTLAQAALESAWGSKAPGNNLFGIKADKSWTGATVLVPTHEVINGVRQSVSAKFRAYVTWQECMDDHAKFLTNNPRYALAFHAGGACEFASCAAAAGYATDPDYAKKITSIIRTYNLEELYDGKAA